MQDIVAGGLGRAVARDQAVRIKRDRLVALVRHLVLEGEQVILVDRDHAAELQALAIVPGQRHRMADGERP